MLDPITNQQVRLLIPNHIVKFPKGSENGEYMFIPAEDDSGEFEFLCTEDINVVTPSDPDDLESMVVFNTVRGDRWPAHTQKAVLQMSEHLGTLTVLNGGLE
jgi:hypothetical protein